MATVAPSSKASAAAERARQIAAKYSGEGQSFHVKYLGTQEVSSAKGDAVVADCLKELRMQFKDVVVHLPKVVVSLTLGGITVTEEKSKFPTIQVPLEHVSYVCLDPADDSVFSFIIRSKDTISSKGLRLHAFVAHPQIAITFNRSARELFEFMARIVRAKKKIAQQEAESGGVSSNSQLPELAPPPVSAGVQAVVSPPSDSTPQPEEKLVQLPAANSSVPSPGPTDEKARQQTVFDEWKELEKELDDIGQDLGISSPAQVPSTSTPTNSAVSSPAQPDIMTTSGSDPFSGSFYQVSFSGSNGQLPPATAAPTTVGTTNTTTTSAPQENVGDTRVFDNPVFNGFSDNTHPSSEPPPSTPEGKQLTYASRPRPKGKSLDISTPLSPPPVSDTDGGQVKSAREVSLSPNSEEEVKNILANNDPFSPPPLEDFQFQQANSSGESGFFQPASFTPNATHNTGSFFSPPSMMMMAQDSIQLVNPLYQSYPQNESFPGPFSPVQQQVSPVIPMMMSPPPVGLMPQQQPQYLPAQPPLVLQPVPNPTQDLMGHPIMGTNSFDGILSPTSLSSPPLVSSSSYPVQDPTKAAMMREKKDQLFADLLPSTAHPIPEKKKKFEPEIKKVAKPTLAQLQERKKQEDEEAFRVSSSVSNDDEKIEVTVDWPLSPFDDVLPAEPPDSTPEHLLASSTPKSAASTAVSELQSPQQIEPPQAQVLNMDDFDAPFKGAGSQNQSFESAFQAHGALESELAPSPATNDPFAPTGTAVSPTPKTSAAAWSTF